MLPVRVTGLQRRHTRLPLAVCLQHLERVCVHPLDVSDALCVAVVLPRQLHEVLVELRHAARRGKALQEAARVHLQVVRVGGAARVQSQLNPSGVRQAVPQRAVAHTVLQRCALAWSARVSGPSGRRSRQAAATQRQRVRALVVRELQRNRAVSSRLQRNFGVNVVQLD